MGCDQSSADITPGDLLEQEESEAMEVLKLLDITIDETVFFVKLFDKFRQISKGRTTIDEILQKLGMAKNTGTRDIFKRVKSREKNSISFKHFCLAIWLYLTRDSEQLTSMHFDAYDDNGTGELDSKNIFRLVYDLYGVKEDISFKADELLKEVDADKEETITKHEFMSHVFKYKTILQPIYDNQRKVQEKLLGLDFWRKRMARAARILNDARLSNLFYPLPNTDYYYRERISRLPTFAKVNSYRRKTARKAVMNRAQSVDAINIAERALPVAQNVPDINTQRRRSVQVDNTISGPVSYNLAPLSSDDFRSNFATTRRDSKPLEKRTSELL